MLDVGNQTLMFLNIFSSDLSLTLEFACSHLVVRNHNGAFSWSLSVTCDPRVYYRARVWNRVNLESLESHLFGVSLKLERLKSKLGYEREIFSVAKPQLKY